MLPITRLKYKLDNETHMYQVTTFSRYLALSDISIVQPFFLYWRMDITKESKQITFGKSQPTGDQEFNQSDIFIKELGL